MGTHLWSKANTELQHVFDTKKYFSKSIRTNYCKSINERIIASCGTCTSTNPPYVYIITLHFKKVILTSIRPQGLTGLGRFDSINSC